MTVIDLAITLQVSDDDKVLEPYRAMVLPHPASGSARLGV
jgi:hypothetical protein